MELIISHKSLLEFVEMNELFSPKTVPEIKMKLPQPP